MKNRIVAIVVLSVTVFSPAFATGLTGDPEAISWAERMVERVGGKALWAQLVSLHLTQRFYVLEWKESIIHDEWIDFVTPRLRVSIQNELGLRLRAYDARGGWRWLDGEFSRFSDEHLAMERGFWKRDMFRMFHLIAAEDPSIELRMEGSDRLEVYEKSGEPLCWFRLSPLGDPVLWGAAVGEHKLEFIFGPLEQYGNIRVPRWGGFTDGSWRFDMLDARGSDQPPQVSYDPPDIAGSPSQ